VRPLRSTADGSGESMSAGGRSAVDFRSFAALNSLAHAVRTQQAFFRKTPEAAVPLVKTSSWPRTESSKLQSSIRLTVRQVCARSDPPSPGLVSDSRMRRGVCSPRPAWLRCRIGRPGLQVDDPRFRPTTFFSTSRTPRTPRMSILRHSAGGLWR
jgi:hypothetical protein